MFELRERGDKVGMDWSSTDPLDFHWDDEKLRGFECHELQKKTWKQNLELIYVDTYVYLYLYIYIYYEYLYVQMEVGSWGHCEQSQTCIAGNGLECEVGHTLVCL